MLTPKYLVAPVLSFACCFAAVAACSNSDTTSDTEASTSDASVDTTDGASTTTEASTSSDAATALDTGVTLSDGLVVSESTANTTTQNGPFTGTAFAVKYPASDAGAGQVNVGIGMPDHSIEFNCDIFKLTVAAGTTFDVATSKEIHCSFLENGKLFMADTGSLVVSTLSDTEAKIGLVNVHYSAVPPFMPSDPTPTGAFVVNGSISSPITVFSM